MKSYLRISRRGFLRTAAALVAARSQLARAAGDGVSFLAVGDWGMETNEQRRVAVQMAKSAEAIGARFVISTGDNFYPKGVASVEDMRWKTSFEEVYAAPALMIPWYVALGNHDHRGSVDAQVNYTKGSARWRLPATYYKHTEMLADGSLADFFFIDSHVIKDTYRSWFRSTTDEQIIWLERALAASTARWKIVVGHHPVVSGGKHGDTEALVVLMKPLLERYGVQLYLSGHDHDLQHLVPGKVHYLISGAGANPRPSWPLAGTRFVMGERLGFMAARLTPHLMEIEFIDDEGTSLYRSIIPVEV